MKRPVRTQGDVNRGVLDDALKKIRRDLETGNVNVPQGNIPKGTGFRHITDDLEDPQAKLVGTNDVQDHAVSYIKIQNVSATDKLLGRQSGGPGVIEEIDCTAAGRALLDDADAAEQRTTLGLVAQPHIADPVGGAVIDIEARAALVSLLDLVEATFLMEP